MSATPAKDRGPGNAAAYNFPPIIVQGAHRKLILRRRPPNAADCLWLFIRRLRRRRLTTPVCARCGYPARELTEPVCPECGSDLCDHGVLRDKPGDNVIAPHLLLLLAPLAVWLIFTINHYDAWLRNVWHFQPYTKRKLEWDVDYIARGGLKVQMHV